MAMTCIEATKGQVCSRCGKAFRKGELIFDHPEGLLHAEFCGFYKDHGDRKKRVIITSTPMYAGKSIIEDKLRKRAAVGFSAKVTVSTFDESDELKDVMSDKLRKDINKMGRKVK